MDWFDPSDEVIVDPRVDGPRHWRRMYGTDEIEVSRRLIFANNGLGRLFDATRRALDDVAEPVQDLRDRGYARFRYPDGQVVTISRAVEPAPYCAANLETLVVAGAQEILFVNGSGSLQPALAVGGLAVPGDLVREEGTSYHYVPTAVALRTDDELSRRLVELAQARGLRAARGGHWTTDALYRETVGKVQAMRERGVATVDMELTALAGVAHYYDRRFAALLVVTDLVTPGHTWDGLETEEFAAGVQAAAAIAARAFMGS